MKAVFRIVLILLLIGNNVEIFSQHLSAGFYSGMNISDIHGQDLSGKWRHKPGPSEGFSLGYSFNRALGFETGLEYSTVYYEYYYYAPYYYPLPFYNTREFIAPVYYNFVNNMNFSYFRVPLMLTLKVPSVVDLNLKAGIFYSFLTGNWAVDPIYSSNITPVKKDFGYIFSSGISYPLNDKVEAIFNVNYITGRKQFLNDYRYRNGMTEFVAGINFTFSGSSGMSDHYRSSDSLSGVTVTYKAGVSVSWIPQPSTYGTYHPVTGQVMGFSVNIPFANGMKLITGTTFERKGYGIRDSSNSYYRLILNSDPHYYVDTKVQTDYAVIPLLVGIPIDKARNFYIRTGPWLAFKLNSRTVGTSYNVIRSYSTYTHQKTYVYDDLTRIIKGTDSGWLFGAGFSVPLRKRSQLEFDLNYSAGFGNVFDDPETSGTQGVDYIKHMIRNRSLSFTIGYSILPSGH